MTYEEAVKYLESCVNYEWIHQPQAMRAVRLSRMRRLCERLGDPQRRFRSILVAGTNGKGSICAMLYSMLRESSLRAGLYTSPHLEHLRERIRVWTAGPSREERVHGEDWISEEAFASVIEAIQPAVDEMRGESPELAPSYFEVLTAAAFVSFNQRGVDLAVLEVGLGGRLDATNVVDQAVSVLAPIGVDHADVLGSGPVLIAKEKAGILKSSHPVISAPQPEGVDEVLRVICEEQAAPLFTCGKELTVGIQQHNLDGLQISITGLRGVYESLALPLLGRHQAQNAAVAVGALEALSGTGIPYSLVERGLARVEWPGRLEIVHEEPLVLMDGGHNAQAASAVVEALTELCPGRTTHLLIGMSSDKSVEDVGRRLGGISISATCTKSQHPRSMEPVELARRLSPFCPDVHVMSDPADAYTYLLNAVSPQDVILVTGSLFLVGELRAALRHAHVRPKRTPVEA